MDTKLFDSELKVMNVLWREGVAPARLVAAELNRSVGWNVNTSYTLIKRLIGKGIVERSEPGFMCQPLVPKEDVQRALTDQLIDKVFDGKPEKLLNHLLARQADKTA